MVPVATWGVATLGRVYLLEHFRVPAILRVELNRVVVQTISAWGMGANLYHVDGYGMHQQNRAKRSLGVVRIVRVNVLNLIGRIVTRLGKTEGRLQQDVFLRK